MTTGAPPDLAVVDVCVVGAGSAGSSAAIAAARGGASVLLVDRLPFLGGTSTAVLDTFYGFYTPGTRSRKVVGGIGDDVVAGLRALGPVLERPNTYGAGTGVTYHRRTPEGRLGGPGRRGGRADPPPRDAPGRRGARRPGEARSSSRHGPGSAASARRSSSTRRATPTVPFARVRLRAGGRNRSGADADDDVPHGQRRPRAATGRLEGRVPRADGRGGRVRRVRPAAPRGQRPHHAGRRDDRNGHDPARLVPARATTAGSSTRRTRGS